MKVGNAVITTKERVELWYNEKSGEAELLIGSGDVCRRLQFKRIRQSNYKRSDNLHRYLIHWRFKKLAEGSQELRYKVVQKKIWL